MMKIGNTCAKHGGAAAETAAAKGHG